MTIPIESELSACVWSTTWGSWAPECVSQTRSEVISSQITLGTHWYEGRYWRILSKDYFYNIYENYVFSMSWKYEFIFFLHCWYILELEDSVWLLLNVLLLFQLFILLITLVNFVGLARYALNCLCLEASFPWDDIQNLKKMPKLLIFSRTTVIFKEVENKKYLFLKMLMVENINCFLKENKIDFFQSI